MVPEPSPSTNPSRSKSKGLEAVVTSRLVVIALIAQKPANDNLVMDASAPPAIIISAASLCMILKASPIALVEEAQAETVHSVNPLMPYLIATRPAAILGTS